MDAQIENSLKFPVNTLMLSELFPIVTRYGVWGIDKRAKQEDDSITHQIGSYERTYYNNSMAKMCSNYPRVFHVCMNTPPLFVIAYEK